MANGTRYNAIVGQLIDLEAQFALNNHPFDAYQVQKVEIFKEENVILQTITDITRINVGLYKYTVNPLNIEGTYHDKIYIVPREGYAPRTYTNYFYVRPEDWGGLPSNFPDRCLVNGYLIDMSGNVIQNANIKIELVEPKLVNEFSIVDLVQNIKTNSVGFWSVFLIRSKTNLRFKYRFTISYTDNDGNNFSNAFIRYVPDLDECLFTNLLTF